MNRLTALLVLALCPAALAEDSFYMVKPGVRQRLQMDGKRVPTMGYWFAVPNDDEPGTFQVGDAFVSAADVIESSRASQYFDEYVRQNPEVKEGYLLRAAVSLVRSDYPGVIADCDRAIKHDGKFAPAYLMRAYASSFLRKFDEAYADAAVAEKLIPNDPAVLTVRGAIKSIQGDLKGALADYSEALTLQPHQRSELLQERAKIYAALGQHEKAGREYTEILAGDPQSVSALVGRARALRNAGRLRWALADVERALSFKTDDFTAQLLRAELLFHDGQSLAAFRNAEKCLEVDPRSGAAFHTKLLALLVLGRSESVLSELARFGETTTAPPIVRQYRGLAQWQRKDFSNAARTLETVLTDHELAPRAQALRIRCILRTKDSASAERLIKQFPDESRTEREFMLAELEWKLVQGESAQFQEWLDNFTDGEIYRVLAVASYQASDFQKARRHLDFAIQAEESAEAYRLRSLLRSACPDKGMHDATASILDAARAVELCNSEDAYALAAIAAAFAREGDFDRAVKHQLEAVTALGASDDSAEFKSRLKLYESKQPLRIAPKEKQLELW